MTEKAGGQVSALATRRTIAAEVETWIERGANVHVAPIRAIRELAAHATKESDLDRRVDGLDPERVSITLDRVQALSRHLSGEAFLSASATHEAAGALLLLAAELIAADRRLAKVVTPEDRDRAIAALLTLPDVRVGETEQQAAALCVTTVLETLGFRDMLRLIEEGRQ